MFIFLIDMELEYYMRRCLPTGA